MYFIVMIIFLNRIIMLPVVAKRAPFTSWLFGESEQR